MKTIEITRTAVLADNINELAGEPLIITHHGKPVAAIISLENMDLETAELSSNPKFMAIIERARTRYKKEGGITSKDMRRKLKIND